MIYSNQLRAARALVGMSQAELAKAAGLSVPTVKRAEGAGVLAASDHSISALAQALEQAGVEFIEENGRGPGVRLKERTGDATLGD
ncbi:MULTISPECIES: helix-turn-helix transcriptional regulator [unclassified Roseovarius]|uniref:helix-turn-helix domain-containing protein n=1 Tax=unclassified Roseovarius TaxID=2614913 RepID=UPI00273D969C|nr:MULTISPECIES: helix-turn-helix transcriptional regulator [unclassified Roseovarius]